MRVRNRRHDFWREIEEDGVRPYRGRILLAGMIATGGGYVLGHFLLHGYEYPLSLATYIAGLFVAHRWLVGPVTRRKYRERKDLCAQCGYDLRGSPERCPECGTPNPSGISFY